MIEVDEDANGRELEVPLNGELKLTLRENPSTGFAWTAESLAPAVLDLLSDDFEEASSARGGGGTRVWKFNAKQKGEGKISLHYRRKWETKDPAKSFALTVRVN